MALEDKKGILLESGTNELEIIEFGIGNNAFGINVMKVREVINVMEVTPSPNSHPYVEGIIQLRDEVLPVVDLAKALKLSPSDTPKHDKFIIAELNKVKVAFHVHTVSRIHRISWEQIEKPSQLSQGLEISTNGIIKLENRLILFLDFEKVVVEISPDSGINVSQMKNLENRERSNKRILVAEDSAVLRKLIEETLSKAGYKHVSFFENGSLAWQHLEAIVVNNPEVDIKDYYHLIITDIEMPKMDGHHFTKRVKEHALLKKLPIVIFSSIISDDLKHKGQQVGADAQVTKPEILELVKVIDQLVL